PGLVVGRLDDECALLIEQLGSGADGTNGIETVFQDMRHDDAVEPLAADLLGRFLGRPEEDPQPATLSHHPGGGIGLDPDDLMSRAAQECQEAAIAASQVADPGPRLKASTRPGFIHPHAAIVMPGEPGADPVQQRVRRTWWVDPSFGMSIVLVDLV